jgi:hypothetical protein
MVYSVLTLRRSDHTHMLDHFDSPEKAMRKFVSVARFNSPVPPSEGFLADFRAQVLMAVKSGDKVAWSTEDDNVTVIVQTIKVR